MKTRPFIFMGICEQPRVSNVIKIRDLPPEMRSGMEPRPYAKRGFVGSGFHP